MSEIQIPPEARKAAFEAWNDAINGDGREPLEAAIRAALKAWPGMVIGKDFNDGSPVVFLPLPTEPRDE